MPTHRELAWRLKVNVSTVTQAYREAARRAARRNARARDRIVKPGTEGLDSMDRAKATRGALRGSH